MNDQTFLDYVLRYAAAVKGSSISSEEQKAIISEFNSTSGDALGRAVDAIAKVLSQRILAEELSKNLNLDNTERLLHDLQSAAAQWQSGKPK